MFEFDQETWIYFALIAVFLIYFIWNSRRAKKERKARKNKNFRRRYMERRREENSETRT
jgi:membrane protein implicated in regulation of membrane protease activity